MIAFHLPGQLALLKDAPVRTGAGRKRMRRRASEVPKGYAAQPGSGPGGETCATCRHLARKRRAARTCLKCELNRGAWTRAPGTDVRAGSPACQRWARMEPGS